MIGFPHMKQLHTVFLYHAELVFFLYSVKLLCVENHYNFIYRPDYK